MPRASHTVTAGIRGLRRATMPLLVLVAIVVVFLPLSRAYDLRVFLHAGYAALHGLQIYPHPGSRAVYSGFSFVYPYVALWPFVPLAAMPVGLSTAVFFAISATAVVGACFLGTERDPLPAVLVLSTAFTITGLQLGALSPLLFAGAVLLWHLRERPFGFALIAAAVVASKLFLMPLLAWPLLARRFRAFASASVLALVLVAFGFAVGPLDPGPYLRLLSQLGAHEARSGFGVFGALMNAGAAPRTAQAAAIAMAAAAFLAAYLRYRRVGDERILYCAGIVGSLVLTPVLWSHYLVLLAAALIVLDAPRRWLVLFALSSWAIAPPHGAHTEVPGPEWFEASVPWLPVTAALVCVALIGFSGVGDDGAGRARRWRS